jgi:hypothetical protein
MTPENPKLPSSEEQDQVDSEFANEDEVRIILEQGSANKIEALRQHHNWSPEQIGLYQYYAQLRKTTLEDMHREIEIREQTNPKATPEELDMGAYTESIEPQVRSAVTTLRAKGYNTYLSGFSGLDNQKIATQGTDFFNLNVPDELIEELKQDGISISVEKNSITLTCEKVLTLNELTKVWDKIEQIVPQNAQSAEVNDKPSALSFRRKQVG